jgi:hypothetical protein
MNLLMVLLTTDQLMDFTDYGMGESMSCFSASRWISNCRERIALSDQLITHQVMGYKDFGRL